MPRLPLAQDSLSPWQRFANKWAKGCGADECAKVSNICLARGSVPCDILFIGEAPGPSEDTLGLPFVGPAGKLLDEIIQHSIGDANLNRAADGMPLITYAVTNLVACIPLDDNQDKFTQPPEEQMDCCQPRLEEFIRLCKPRLAVSVGKLAKERMEQGYQHSMRVLKGVYTEHLVHPAAILRAHITQKDLEFQRAIVTLREAIERFL